MKLLYFYGKELNTNSPAQVGVFVYEFLECPKHYHINPNGDKVLSTDADTLEEIYKKEVSDPLKRKWLEKVVFCRKIDKILEALDKNICIDGKMRCSYKLHGTESGRTSGGEYIGWYFNLKKGKIKIEKLGMSFQTIPKHGFNYNDQWYGNDLREIYVPSDGCCFVEADGSNAEGHVVAVLSEDWDMLNYMKMGGDVHKLTASWITLLPIKLIKKPSPERDLGKTARHAGNLGQSASGLAITAHIPLDTATKIIERFHQNAPKVREVFHNTIINILKGKKANRYLISPHGRRRDFFGRVDQHMEKEAFSFLPQSTVSDHYKLASLRIANRTEKELGAQQIFEAHDGLMWECPVGNKEKLALIAHEEMATEINFSKCTLKRDYELLIPVELGYSDTNWHEMRDLRLL
jgi:DNA polymerase I - 3''-5'' exonuclease and polymerase domains